LYNHSLMPMNQTDIDEKLTADQALDAKGLNCPLPILKTKVLLNKMQPGQILFVEATDPHSVVDFEAYAARTRHEILRQTEQGGIYEFYIRRAENPRET
jgi:tRNA 2-thiouridine synthesizing protein A